MDHYKLFIDGEFVDAAGGATFQSIDPGTGKPFATVAKAGKADAEAAVAAARRAFDSGVWSGLTPVERAVKVNAFADQVAQLTLRMAVVEAMDSGQIIRLSKVWGRQGSGLLRNFAHYAARRFPWEEEIPYAGNVFSPGRDYIRREPIGVCVGIIPWNFPISMAFWKIGHAIVMGNTVVLKPASATPLGALIIAEAAKAAGIPKGVINVLPGPGGELGDVLCTHPAVDKIAFTGSTEVGRDIMKMAADSVKKVTLELGGKSANIICPDADIDLAVEGALFGTFFHQGQVCESGTRVLVAAEIHDQFLEKMKRRAEGLRIGYQLDPTTHQGPLASSSQLATVEDYVRIGREAGAQLVTGGERAVVKGHEEGYFYKPTIFAGVGNDMRIAREEIFGPVVCVIKYDSEEEAIQIANDSIYGLAGGVFSRSTRRAENIARQIRTGTMWINNYHSFGDFCPFGGYKQSGFGRELGHEGLAEYTQVKRVHVSAVADHKANFTMKMFSDDPTLPFVQYSTPTMVLAGHGCLASVAREVVRLRGRRAMVMTDAGVRNAGLFDYVREALGDFYAGVFDRIPQDSDLETVDAATDAARALGADIIVSVGGGSVIDTAKAVCVTLKNGGRADDHISLQRLIEPQTPHIVIPTTAGTGSEVTNTAVIKSGQAGRKVYIVENFMVPNTAILDPLFTLTLPPHLTVTTAMDAMTHAVEALTSIKSNPICDGHALNAVRLIADHLPRVIENGQDEQSRLNLQIAATTAGWAFNISQVGLAHAMAHTLGWLAKVPHGSACGIALPAVMRFNADHATEKLALVARSMGVNIVDLKGRDAALAAAEAVEALMKRCGHPMRLRDVGVAEDLLPTAALHAIADAPAMFNARPVGDPALVEQLFKEIY
ncbi:aldehyde dehydrogenase family protein [Desulfatitalea alkaliphila]|uniref:Aldehyde dehydrogenase family protein n=1 Tax=Desulfatitalea alkaliphila TaxID=2929485 RepID=A0AA41RAB0_9BACT|nr:aldehyde dehydrogenase family protein [Desulfatitalea alkaliphila]MCJ8501563.1 aldehyde dehydrogenase family protein [Desulfatitalea alkaliphila]